MADTNFESAKKFVNMKRMHNEESLSGPGSHIENTRETVRIINEIIKKRKINTILDLGCGDWNWFNNIELNNTKYIGWDADEDMINTNRTKYGKDNIKFELNDIILSDYPDVDLIICRDVLFHLDISLSMKCINKIKEHCKYFLSTNFNYVSENQNIKKYTNFDNWGFYTINLHIEPFNLKPYLIDSVVEPNNSAYGYSRYVNIYRLTDNVKITKNIFLFWAQGFENAPIMINKCVESWKKHNSDWDIHMVDLKNLHEYIKIEEYIDISLLLNLKLAHFSDIIRMLLLKKYGGVWCDSTTFCMRPLTEWLMNHIDEGFFVFDKPHLDRMISNFFIYSEKDNYVLYKWCSETINYYKQQRVEENYFIHHELFKQLYNTDNNFKDIWDKIDKVSAVDLHFLQHNGLYNNVTIETKSHIDNIILPFYKLRYQEDGMKNIFYLYNTLTK